MHDLVYPNEHEVDEENLNILSYMKSFNRRVKVPSYYGRKLNKIYN